MAARLSSNRHHDGPHACDRGMGLSAALGRQRELHRDGAGPTGDGALGRADPAADERIRADDAHRIEFRSVLRDRHDFSLPCMDCRGQRGMAAERLASLLSGDALHRRLRAGRLHNRHVPHGDDGAVFRAVAMASAGRRPVRDPADLRARKRHVPRLHRRRFPHMAGRPHRGRRDAGLLPRRLLSGASRVAWNRECPSHAGDFSISSRRSP